MVRILLIEDSDELRADMIEMLSIEGYTMLEAADGRAGLEMAFAHVPDLIICDVLMPLMDGYEVLEKLRASPLTATIPFIFLTSRSEHQSQRRGMRMGADDYLVKPFNIDELLSVIHVQLKKLEDMRAVADKQLEHLRMNIITAMPHELRTPLNTILGFSEMLIAEADNISSQQIKEWAQFIHNAGARLMRMAENYLVYARVSVALDDPAERAALRQEHITEPHELLAVQAEQVAQRYERLGDLQLDLQPVSSVQCSYTHFVKIVDELLDNAFKFSEAGHAVWLRAALEGNHYMIYIQDHGHGISPEYLAQLGAYMQFDRWFYEQQGSGLGLGIVVQMMRLHDGIFDISSSVGAGTRVKIGLQANLSNAN